MKKTNTTKIIVLVAVLVIAATAAAGLYWQLAAPRAPQAETAAPTASQPTQLTEPTAPTETVPEETVPVETVPAVDWGNKVASIEKKVYFPPEGELEVSKRWIGALTWHDNTADNYFVYDLNRDVYRVRSASEDTILYPASITKLFTAYTALQCVPADMQITAGSELSFVIPYSSVAEIMKGDTLTVEQLIAAMLLPSGNDAAYVLAVGVGRELAGDPELSKEEAVACFIARMNEEAEKAGMTSSHFVTPDGIHDDNHYISMRDFVTLGRLSIENEIIAKYAAAARWTITTAEGRSLGWLNSNLLLQPEEWFQCKQALGLKTGYTTPAGYCLLSYIKVGERDLLIGVFGCDTADDRFADTVLLLNQVFEKTP